MSPIIARLLFMICGLALPALGLLGTCPADGAEPVAKSLFNGRDLGDWKPVVFGGDGEVLVEEGAIVLERGDTLTGITWQGEFPKQNYEIRLEAQRAEGIDFFCGLTFPVAESHCSFIVGGWAGAVVGLSSIDGKDASENDTTTYMKFEKGRWYALRVRVTPERIACWIDDARVVDQPLAGRKISTRNEVDLSKPLGLTSWQTTAKVRKIEWIPLLEKP